MRCRTSGTRPLAACSTPLGVTAINAYEMSYQSHQAFGRVLNTSRVTAINAYEMSYQSHQAFGCVRNQAQADGQLWHWESGYRHWTRAAALIRPVLSPCGDVGDAQSGTLDPRGFRQLPKLPMGTRTRDM